MSSCYFDQIQELELNAWPDLIGVYRDGWRIRLAGGFTGRANSALALRPDVTLDAAGLGAIEALYRLHGITPRVRITEFCAKDVDTRLGDHGYHIGHASQFRAAPIDPTLEVDAQTVIAASPPGGWVADFGRMNGRGDFNADVMTAILGRILLPTGFARLIEDGETRAIGMGVVDRDRMEVQSIVVDWSVRGRGFGRRLVASLLAWGRSQGAKTAILSVAADNAPAIKLYSGLGFEQIGGYHYRVKP